MKALLIAPRLPGTGFTGDRIRSQLHLDALRLAGFVVTLVGSVGGSIEVPPLDGVRILPVPVDRSRIPYSLLRHFLSGDPLQSALQEGPWTRVLETAGSEFDLVVWSLVRIWPFVRGRLPDAPIVLDYIDALGAAANQAARTDAALWRRLYWKAEAPRLLRAERDAGEGTVLRLATTDRDVSRLPNGTEMLAHGVEIRPLAPGRREPIVAFSGRLMYRPNQLAVRRVVERIWPLVRQQVPAARLVLGGADAPGWIRRLHGRDGVEVESPVADMSLFLRRARVGVAPVDLGMGTPNKLFESLEAGTPVVASDEVTKRAGTNGILPPVRTAATDAGFAEELVRYLESPSRAEEDGAAGRRFVEVHASRRLAIEGLAKRFRSLAGRA